MDGRNVEEVKRTAWGTKAAPKQPYSIDNRIEGNTPLWEEEKLQKHCREYEPEAPPVVWQSEDARGTDIERRLTMTVSE